MIHKVIKNTIILILTHNYIFTIMIVYIIISGVIYNNYMFFNEKNIKITPFVLILFDTHINITSKTESSDLYVNYVTLNE